VLATEQLQARSCAHPPPTLTTLEAGPPSLRRILQAARKGASRASNIARRVLLFSAGIAEADAFEKVAKVITAELLVVTSGG
jgi:hypothetical protein